tara:strand:+ start:824 stop:1066 length:243 start_codon:yes stop_codon:yes gene_type:complete
LKSKSDDYYANEKWWKEYIVRWNKAQEVMGVKQTLWVLRIEMKYEGYLHEMDPMNWDVLMRKLRHRYHYLIKMGKLDAKV